MDVDFSLELVLAIAGVLAAIGGTGAAVLTALVAWWSLARKIAGERADRDKAEGRRQQWERSVDAQLTSRKAEAKELSDKGSSEHAQLRKEMQDGFRDLRERIDAVADRQRRFHPDDS